MKGGKKMKEKTFMLVGIILAVIFLVSVLGLACYMEKATGMDKVYKQNQMNYERCANNCFNRYETEFKIRKCDDDCYRCHIYKTTCN